MGKALIWVRLLKSPHFSNIWLHKIFKPLREPYTPVTGWKNPITPWQRNPAGADPGNSVQASDPSGAAPPTQADMIPASTVSQCGPTGGPTIPATIGTDGKGIKGHTKQTSSRNSKYFIKINLRGTRRDTWRRTRCEFAQASEHHRIALQKCTWFFSNLADIISFFDYYII